MWGYSVRMPVRGKLHDLTTSKDSRPCFFPARKYKLCMGLEGDRLSQHETGGSPRDRPEIGARSNRARKRCPRLTEYAPVVVVSPDLTQPRARFERGGSPPMPSRRRRQRSGDHVSLQAPTKEGEFCSDVWQLYCAIVTSVTVRSFISFA